MDVLTAHTPSGFLHAVTCDRPKGFGLGFERTMQAQGCRVTRYSMADYLAQQKARSQPAQNPASTQAIRTLEPEGAWPELGQNIVHHVIGYSTVTHTVTLEGESVPVATGPKGQGLVRAGQWRAATEADKPYWMRLQDDVSSASRTEEPPDAAQILKQVKQFVNEQASAAPAEMSTTVDMPKASRMVGLFELGDTA